MGIDAFRQGLREHGYVEGQNITVEFRGADSKTERLPRPGHRAGSSQGRPHRGCGDAPASRAAGGNVTGSTFLGPELIPKRLALLKEALPTVSRVAGLWHPGAFGESTTKRMLNEAEAAARTQALRLQLVGVQAPTSSTAHSPR